jgi:hypothetical protein
LQTVTHYFSETYGFDICAPEHDSMEGIMTRLYPDMFNVLLADDSLTAFRALLQLFTSRLADTTNDLRVTQRRLLYRIIVQLLTDGCKPSDITIITFNQDLQAEKILQHLGETKRWEGFAQELFSFPALYSIPESTWKGISGPSGSSDDVFPSTTPKGDYLRVLKLHGSLNWYSTHNSPKPSRKAMLDIHRRLAVTRRRTIDPDMRFGVKRKVYTQPVVVPPVNHKSSVMPTALGPVWTLAEERIEEADDVVVFGYSCPALDFESANLLRRAQRQRSSTSTFSVIDPNGSVVTRYIDLLDPDRLSYYSTAHKFLV